MHQVSPDEPLALALEFSLNPLEGFVDAKEEETRLERLEPGGWGRRRGKEVLDWLGGGK